MSGLVLIGAEGEEETNQGPAANSHSSGRFPGRGGAVLQQQLLGPENPLGTSLSGLGGGRLGAPLLSLDLEGEKVLVGEACAWMVWGESGHRQTRDSASKGLEEREARPPCFLRFPGTLT